MRTLLVLAIHLVASIAKLLGPGGARGLLAETLVVKHQLLVINRARHRAPNLTSYDRIVLVSFLNIHPLKDSKSDVA